LGKSLEIIQNKIDIRERGGERGRGRKDVDSRSRELRIYCVNEWLTLVIRNEILRLSINSPY